MDKKKKANSKFALIYLISAILLTILFFIVALKEYDIGYSTILSVFFLILLGVYYLFIRFLSFLVALITKVPKKYLYIIISLVGFPLLFYVFVCLIEQKIIPLASLNADNWIGIFGGILGYYGACVLGFLAFWQNEKSTEISEKLAQIALADNYCAIQPKEKVFYSLKQNQDTTVTWSAKHKIDSDSIVFVEKYDTERVLALNEYFMRLYFRDFSTARLKSVTTEHVLFVQDPSENGLFWADGTDDPIPQEVLPFVSNECVIDWISDKEFYINFKIYSPENGVISNMLNNKETVCLMLSLQLENIANVSSHTNIRLWFNKGKNKDLRMVHTSTQIE